MSNDFHKKNSHEPKKCASRINYSRNRKFSNQFPNSSSRTKRFDPRICFFFFQKMSRYNFALFSSSFCTKFVQNSPNQFHKYSNAPNENSSRIYLSRKCPDSTIHEFQISSDDEKCNVHKKKTSMNQSHDFNCFHYAR